MILANKFRKQAERDYLAFVTRKHLCFDRMVAFSGFDNLKTVAPRLNYLFPKENIPDERWFKDLCQEYLNDPDAFMKEEEENICQYCDLWEDNEPMIEEIKAFQKQHDNGKGIVMHSRRSEYGCLNL